jgi:hypothetical protein
VTLLIEFQSTTDDVCLHAAFKGAHVSLSARLDRLPLSKPHYALLLIGGLGYTFDGMDNAVVAFLLPDVKAAFGLSSPQLGLVASAAPSGTCSAPSSPGT